MFFLQEDVGRRPVCGVLIWQNKKRMKGRSVPYTRLDRSYEVS